MKNKELGKTGLKVGVIGFGGIPIQRITKEEAKEVILAAVDSGINFIDTARGYTDSEEKIGEALEELDKKPLLATKAMDRTKDAMWASIRTSLKNLKVGCIDLYQVHNVATDDALKQVLVEGGALEALQEAKERGLIKHIGVTGHKPEILTKALDTGLFETVQLPFNAIEQEHFLPILKKAKALGMGTIIMKPMAGGALKHGKEALQFILKYDVDVIIPGMDSVKQVHENVKAGEGKLSIEGEKLLEEERKTLGKDFCRMCGYCGPCPQGIDIPVHMIMNAYYERYEMKEWARKRILTFKTAYADSCTQCGACEKRCPYDLPIREHLKRARKNLIDPIE
jgi:uncharacterized protein